MKKITLKKSDILSGGINAIRQAVDGCPDECVISIEKGDYFFGFADTKPAYYSISNTFCKRQGTHFFKSRISATSELIFAVPIWFFRGGLCPLP